MASFDLVVFDCDGVLVDSEIVSISHEMRALHDLGWQITLEDAFDRFVGLSQKSANEIIETEIGRKLPEGWGDALQHRVVEAFATELQPIAGIADTLDRLHLPRCVASSSRPERIRRSLTLVGIIDRFEPNIFSSTMVQRGKPYPDLFLYAAEKMGADPERCVVIEDSPAGVKAAVSAGMTPFGFTGGGHAGSARWAERLKDAGAALLFDDMSRLTTLIEEYRRT